MLRKIICEKFLQKEIIFHEGLNSIIGDNDASNSIGKSIMLMIIDFTFGGENYIKKNDDVIKNIGHHDIKFAFEFDKKLFYFLRNTSTYKSISICNDNFESIDYITSVEFNSFLKERYNCKIDDISFREIIGLFFRIYGKENLKEKKPLQAYDTEKSIESVNGLLKIFDKYSDIKYLHETLESAKKDKSILNSAMQRELIPTVESSIFFRNRQSISDLERRLTFLRNDVLKNSSSAIAVISEDIIELRDKKSELILKRSRLFGRLRRINYNLEKSIKPFLKEIKQLVEFFPDINIEKINEIETFHSKLTKNLKDELLKAKVEIQQEIDLVNLEINNTTNEIEEKLKVEDIPSVAVDSLIKVAAEIKRLKEVNRAYEREQEAETTIKSTSSDLKQLKERALQDVQAQINHQMSAINRHIYGDGRKPPILYLSDKSYRFDRQDDRGTGTAFVSLITFDLSILNLTVLPALAHDLPLLKNIEDNAFSKIVQLYSGNTKQIFIAIDKLPSYDERTQKILNDCSVLKLSKQNLLFGINWKKG